jgi:hypothetical protein
VLQSNKVMLQGELLTQIFEVAPNKFLVASWGSAWAAVIDKLANTVSKIYCPETDHN